MVALLDEARSLDLALRQALAEHRSAEHRTAMLLVQMYQGRLFRQLGYISIHAYAHEVLDLPIRQSRSLLQLGRSLPELPSLDTAFAAGELGWTKARELLRVVTPDTEADWVACATACTSRQLEALVSRARIGESPPTDPQEEPRGPARVRMVFHLEASDAEILRDALALARTQLGEGAELVESGALLALIAQRSLHEAEAGTVPTGERTRIVLERCPDCARTTGPEHETSETVSDQATCDAEVVELSTGPSRGHLSRTVPPARRRAVLHRDRMRCVVPGCRCRLFLDLHHLEARALGGDHRESNLVTLCGAHHRLVHDGLLGISRLQDGGLEVRFASGAVSVLPPHVGRRSRACRTRTTSVAGPVRTSHVGQRVSPVPLAPSRAGDDRGEVAVPRG